MIYRNGKGLHTVNREVADGYLQGLRLCRRLKHAILRDARSKTASSYYWISDGSVVYERNSEDGQPDVYRILT